MKCALVLRVRSQTRDNHSGGGHSTIGSEHTEVEEQEEEEEDEDQVEDDVSKEHANKDDSPKTRASNSTGISAHLSPGRIVGVDDGSAETRAPAVRVSNTSARQ